MGETLLHGRVLYFRDVANLYYPAYVLLERSFRQGIWPLWNPGNYAGAPFLMANPIELLLVYGLGADGALRFGPALYLTLAMCGASLLARTLGLGRWGIWSAGLFYGLSGFVLSTVSQFPLLHAAAWAPWVIAAAIATWHRSSRANVVALALALALQLSTLCAELVLQTIVSALTLLVTAPRRRRFLALAGAAGLSGLIAAPALLGAWALVAGTARGRGFTLTQSFAWSVRPAELLDALLPGFFGNVHTMTGAGYWGQPFFTTGFPYFVSLYVGPALLLLALGSGRFPQRARLWWLVVAGLLLAMGSYSPLGWVMQPFMSHFRAPVKFLLMSDLALCLLAAHGLDRFVKTPPRRWWLFLLAGSLLASTSLLLTRWPDGPSRVFARVMPEIADLPARLVIASSWPIAFGCAGILLIGVALALRTTRFRPLAAVLIGFDLLLANGGISVFTDASFYELRPPIRAMIDEARREGGNSRWFSYGAAAGTPGLAWSTPLLHADSDVWLYYLDRQALWPRTNLIDGIDSAFDEDAEGWAPPGSAMDVGERVPARFRSYREALRRAGVRWVLSFDPLPADLVRLRKELPVPEIRSPLHLYEIVDALPRVFWTPDLTALQPAPGSGAVTYERPDGHTVRLHVRAPAGYVIVSEGFDPGWHVDAAGSDRPLLKASDRYWAIPTQGEETLTVRYRPAWRAPALGLCALGLLGALALLIFPTKP